MFSKKATKLTKSSPTIWRLLSKCQIDSEDFVNFCGLLRKHELSRNSILVQGEQFKNQPIHPTPMDTSTSPCCSGRSLYGMQPVVFRLTPQSIESSILKTTNPCRDLKDLCCSYQISCILKIKLNTCSYTEEVAKATKYICNWNICHSCQELLLI